MAYLQAERGGTMIDEDRLAILIMYNIDIVLNRKQG